MFDDEISFHCAVELGIIHDDSLKKSYKVVGWCSILSNATDDAFESAFCRRRKEIKDRYIGTIMNFRGKRIKIIV